MKRGFLNGAEASIYDYRCRKIVVVVDLANLRCSLCRELEVQVEQRTRQSQGAVK